ncbi:MAG TPA: 6-bladed beta-propeller [Bacteroidales bacterium]|nr:hypothetical protein [Bacteroidales bacterium]HRC89615.1 6-bladed beta-propeller [Bacteroidales bacterium]
MKRFLIQLLFFGLYNSIFCQQLPVLNLSSAIGTLENITLSAFVESVTYIPLATTYDCLIDKNPKVYVTKDYIVTVTFLRCLVFNRKNGEFIREIGSYGRGPGEFQNARGFLNEHIPACYFNGWNGNLVKYSIDGAFRGNVRIPGFKDNFDSLSLPMNYSYLNDSIIVCDLLIASGIEPNSLMIFNEKGEALKIFPNRNILETKRNFVLRTGETSFYHFNNNLFFQSMYNDTVFRISIDKITPYFILNRGKHSPPFESKWWSFDKQLQSNFISQPVYLENERYISFNFYLSKNKYFALYDKSLKLLKVADNNSGIKNDIDGFMNITFDSMNWEGELIGILQANELVSWIEKNPEKFKKLNPALQKLGNIGMWDNPVVIIGKYKR